MSEAVFVSQNARLVNSSKEPPFIITPTTAPEGIRRTPIIGDQKTLNRPQRWTIHDLS